MGIKKSLLNYKQVKDIAYKEISQFTKAILFRQLQYQSMLIFVPSAVQPNKIKEILNNKNTNWHFLIVADDYMFQMAKEDKEKCQKQKA